MVEVDKVLAKALVHNILQANGESVDEIEIANVKITGQVKGLVNRERRTFSIDQSILIYDPKPKPVSEAVTEIATEDAVVDVEVEEEANNEEETE